VGSSVTSWLVLRFLTRVNHPQPIGAGSYQNKEQVVAKVLHPLSKEGGGPVKIRPGLTLEQLGKRLPGAWPAVPNPVL
jgi:hypothetical protein